MLQKLGSFPVYLSEDTGFNKIIDFMLIIITTTLALQIRLGLIGIFHMSVGLKCNIFWGEGGQKMTSQGITHLFINP